MTEMIERVARAMYFAGDDVGAETAFSPKNDAHWDHWWREDREVMEAQARAAIAAMREPTSDMMKAAASCPGMKAVGSIVITATVRAGTTNLLPECEEGSCLGSSLHRRYRRHPLRRRP